MLDIVAHELTRRVNARLTAELPGIIEEYHPRVSGRTGTTGADSSLRELRSRLRPGRRSGIIVRFSPFPTSPWNSPNHLNQPTSNAAGTPSGKPKITSLPGVDRSKAPDENFCILLPPPNVTGTLHMGHGFNQTIMDALTRYYRMRGHNTLWQPGTDHAGIATQIVVERQLDAQGISAATISAARSSWKRSGNGRNTPATRLPSQMRRMGTSPDWKRERFTMDAGLNTVVNETFVRLFNEGLIYRGKRLVNWDPKLQYRRVRPRSCAGRRRRLHVAHPLPAGRWQR